MPRTIAVVKLRLAEQQPKQLLQLACPKRSYGAPQVHRYGARRTLEKMFDTPVYFDEQKIKEYLL